MAVSNKRARLYPYIVDISIPKPTIQMVNSVALSPLVVTSTVVTPGNTLVLPAQTSLVVTSTIVEPFIAPATVPLTIAVTLKQPMGQYASLVYTNAGLAGYWRLNESSGTSAIDLKNGNTGVYTSSPTLAQSGPLVSDPDCKAVKLVSSSYVTIPDDADLDVGDVFTVEFFVKLAGTGVHHAFVSKQTNTFGVGIESTNVLSLSKSDVAQLFATTSTLTDTTKWHHVVVTKNGATVHIYLDGSDMALTGSDTTIASNALAMLIGQDLNSGALHATDDQISEVALYNTELSGADVTAHYNAAVADGLVV